MAVCLHLTAAQLAALVAEGWAALSGPHATHDECLAVCEGTTGTSSGQQLGPCVDCGVCNAETYPGMDVSLKLTISGIANDAGCEEPGAEDCTDLNGTHTLATLSECDGHWAPDVACIWEGGPGNLVCEPTGGSFSLSRLTPSGKWILTYNSPNGLENPEYARYEVTTADGDCTLPQTLSLVSNNTVCSWPATCVIDLL